MLVMYTPALLCYDRMALRRTRVNAKKLFQILLGLGIGAFLLWLVFRHTDWGRVFTEIRGVKTAWLLVSQAVLWGTFFVRVQRWSYIVRASDDASFRSMFSATQIGFLVNFTLPGRIGEVVRAVVLGRLAELPFSKCLAMVALDRMTDVIGLIAVLLVSAVAFRPAQDIVLPAEIYTRPIPANLIRSGAVGASVFLLAVMGALVLLYVNQKLLLRVSDRCLGVLSKRLAGAVHRLLEQFAEGLHVFRSAGDMAKAILFSLITWGLMVLSGAFALAAFGFTWPWYAPFMVLALGAAITMLPAAPGFVGQLHFAVVVALCLVMPDLEPAEAKAAAIVMHLLNLFPIAVLGVFCLVRENLGFGELVRRSAQAQ